MSFGVENTLSDLQDSFGNFKGALGIDQTTAAGTGRRITKNHVKRAQFAQLGEDRFRKDVPLKEAIPPAGRLVNFDRLQIYPDQLTLRSQALHTVLTPASRGGSEVQDLLSRFKQGKTLLHLLELEHRASRKVFLFGQFAVIIRTSFHRTTCRKLGIEYTDQMDSIPLLERLKDKLEAIESELHRVIPGNIPPGWAHHQSGHEMPSIPTGLWQRISDPARDLLDRGGKRWRPLFMLLCAEMYGDWHLALPLAPMVEIAHNGSLIVDDIEDGAVQRRGEQAEHIKFGMDLALNAGNLMYFLPARVIDTASYTDAQRLLLHRFYVEDMVRLHFGQGLDILWHGDHENIPTEEQYREMCRLKTGGLSRLAARAAVIAVGGEEDPARRLGRIVEEFGACFQIIDDVKNLGPGVPGKDRGDDIIEGKKSLPIILYLNRHPEEKPRIRRFFEIAGGPDEKAAWDAVGKLIDRIAPSGCLEEAEQQAQGLLVETKGNLEALVPPSAARDQLSELVDLLILG